MLCFLSFFKIPFKSFDSYIFIPDVPPHDALCTAGDTGDELDFLLIIRSQPTALAVLMQAPKLLGSLT